MQHREIKIIRKTSFEPVAYVPKEGSAIYYPGENGACVHRDGTSTPMNYKHLNFASLGYQPLYKGDIVQFITTNIAEVTI